MVNQCSMACIFNTGTVLLDLSAAMTDSFEGRGAYSRWGLIGGFTVICKCSNNVLTNVLLSFYSDMICSRLFSPQRSIEPADLQRLVLTGGDSPIFLSVRPSVLWGGGLSVVHCGSVERSGQSYRRRGSRYAGQR